MLFYASPHVPAGILAITVATVPLLTYAGSVLVRIDALSARRVLGIVVGFFAMLLLVTPESSLPDPSMAPWVGLALLASVLYSILPR